MHARSQGRTEQQLKRQRSSGDAQDDSWMAPRRAPGVTEKLKIRQAVLIGDLHKMDHRLAPAASTTAPHSLCSAPLPNKSSDALPTTQRHRSDSYKPQQPSTSTATKTRRKAGSTKPAAKGNPIKRLLVRLERRSPSQAHRNACARPE